MGGRGTLVKRSYRCRENRRRWELVSTRKYDLLRGFIVYKLPIANLANWLAVFHALAKSSPDCRASEAQ